VPQTSRSRCSSDTYQLYLPPFRYVPFLARRVGIAGMKAPARGHTEIFSEDGARKIGEITSGGFGPTLNKPVAMG
jgi:hypothetical protein